MEKTVKTNDKEQKTAIETPVVTDVTPKKTPPRWLPIVGIALGALILLGAAYCVGYHVGQRHGNNFTRNESTRNGGMVYGDGQMQRGGGMATDGAMRGSHGMNGTFGIVTTVSGNEIAIKDAMRGGTVTYTIDASTKVTQNGVAKSASDIKTGDSVSIVATGGDTTIASTIAIRSTN